MITISHRLCCMKSQLPPTTPRLLSNAVRSNSNENRNTSHSCSFFNCSCRLRRCNHHNNKLLSDNSTSTTATSRILDSNSRLSSLPLDSAHLLKRSKPTTTIAANLINKIRHKNLSSNSKFWYINHQKSVSNHHKLFLLNYTTSCTGKMAQIISGKEVADEIRAKLKARVEKMAVKPKLAIVQVGGREDSNVYIKMKIQFAQSIGASAELVKLTREVTEEDLAKKVNELNLDSNVHGIITQLPFDSVTKIDSDKIVNLIDPRKDVDGLCVYNAGKLLHGELNSSSFIACTPNGCLELIKKSGVNLEGTRSVVIGRSKIVGSPMAQLLLWNNSTVTICHSKTKNLAEVCRQADIVVAAVGRAQMVKKDWLKPGAVVIDCGINVIPDATRKSGTRLVGDVDFEDCKEVAGAITPVPGGVGPMTVAMLIANTVEAASRATSG